MKVISLNLENGKHLDRHINFLHESNADVYCFQEVIASQIDDYKQELGIDEFFFVPLAIKYFPEHLHTQEGDPEEWGVLIMSRHKIICQQVHHIAGIGEHLPTYAYDEQDSMNWALQTIMTEIDGQELTIGNFHFPKSGLRGDVEVTEYQNECLRRLLDALKPYNDIILCGDLNSPRGLPIFDTLATVYRDNIPGHYTTSIDVALHKNGAKDPKGLGRQMIDCLFTTKHYTAKEVELINGVSDHLAVQAVLEKH